MYSKSRKGFWKALQQILYIYFIHIITIRSIYLHNQSLLCTCKYTASRKKCSLCTQTSYVCTVVHIWSEQWEWCYKSEAVICMCLKPKNASFLFADFPFSVFTKKYKVNVSDKFNWEKKYYWKTQTNDFSYETFFSVIL